MTKNSDDDKGADEGEEATEGQPSDELSEDESSKVEAGRAGSSRVIHEVVRLKGDEELERPVVSLILSGFCAGLGISVSVLTQAALHAQLPDTEWRELLVGLGYTTGFLIVIMGHLQLFTESTITAVLPLATHPTWRNVMRLGRLWGIVLVFNLLGTLVVAWLTAREIVVSPDQLGAALDISSHLQERSAWPILLLGIPAGFLIAALAWLLPNAKGSEFWVIIVITYIITICGFSHVVAGSMEAWLLWLAGKASIGWVFSGFIGPVLIGNIIGGTCLFGLLAHGQVRSEL